MARKTFISYKFNDSHNLRNEIINSLGDDARFYKGEEGYNDLSLDNDSKIQNYLKGMIFDTSVTIVIVSRNMKQSNWVEWEIEYSLKNISRDQRTSKTNGIICVIDNDLSPIFQNDFRNIKDFLFPVILKNTNNKKLRYFVITFAKSFHNKYSISFYSCKYNKKCYIYYVYIAIY